MGRRVAGTVFRFLPVLIIGVLLILPLLYLIIKWAEIGVSTGSSSLLNTDNLLLIGKSLFISGSVAVLATAAGAVSGFVLNKLKFRGRGFYKIALLLPLLLPPYVFAVAWKDGLFYLLGNTSGINSIVAVVLIHTLVFSPLAMLITGSAFAQINRGVEEAGLMIIPFRRSIFKILLPLVRSALTISFVLIFIFSLSDFSVPAFFGVRTFTTEIFTQFSAFYNYQVAIEQSIILLIFCLVMLIWEGKYLSEAPIFAISTKGSSSGKYAVKKLKLSLHTVFVSFLFVAVLLPVFILVYQAFSGREVVFGKAWSILAPTISQSITLAFMGAAVTTLTGLWAAYLKERLSFKLPNTFVLITFVVPSTVLGIAIIGFFNRPVTNFIYSSFFMIIIGYMGRFTFIASKIIGNGLKQIPASIDETAIVIGISTVKRFLNITLPLLLPSLFASFVLAFVLSLGELGTTIMIYPPGTELMPVKLFTISANASQALTSSMTLVNLGVSLGFILIFYFGSKIIFKKYGYV